MRKRVKNIKLIEDGFDAEYLADKRLESIQRANRWTTGRRTFEQQHPLAQTMIYLLCPVVPVIAFLGGIWKW